MTRHTLWLTAWLSIANLVSISAHHPLSNYNLDRAQTLEGTLLELRLVNPHSSLTLNVRNEHGQWEPWTVEWGSALLLKKQGVTAGTLAVGDHLTVTGFVALDRSDRRIRLRTIRRPTDGWTWTGGFD